MFKNNDTPYKKLPEKVEFFKEDLICELLTIPKQNPKMERILDMMVWAEIKKIELIETEKGYSNEGQRLGGFKLIGEVMLQEKLTYVADEPEQSVHAVHYNTMKSIFITLPEIIENKKTCELFRMKKIKAIPYIEKVYTRMLDDRHIHKCVMILIDLKINTMGVR